MDDLYLTKIVDHTVVSESLTMHPQRKVSKQFWGRIRDELNLNSLPTPQDSRRPSLSASHGPWVSSKLIFIFYLSPHQTKSKQQLLYGHECKLYNGTRVAIDIQIEVRMPSERPKPKFPSNLNEAFRFQSKRQRTGVKC